MQKVITVSIDVNQLVSQAEGTFAISELEVLNEVLEQGWEIEDWTFLTDDPINGKIPMLVVLNDDMIDEDIDEELWAEEDDFLEEDELDEDDLEDDDLEEGDVEDREASEKGA